MGRLFRINRVGDIGFAAAVLTFALIPAFAFAKGGGHGGGGHSGSHGSHGGSENNMGSGFGGRAIAGSATATKTNTSTATNTATATVNAANQSSSGGTTSGGTTATSSGSTTASSSSLYAPTGTSSSSGGGANNSSSEASQSSYAKVASLYDSASTQSVSIGLLTTAEGLSKTVDGTNLTAEGEALVAKGMKSIEAGEELKKLAQETLDRAAATTMNAAVAPEEIPDEGIFDQLQAATGKSIDYLKGKILGSKGSVAALGESFSNVDKDKVLAAQALTPEELDAATANSKSTAIAQKLPSLRSILAEAMNAQTQAQAVAVAIPAVETEAAPAPVALAPLPAMVVASRAPASVPATEFKDLSQDLPSFEREQAQANEDSLFDKIHRKYADIADTLVKKAR